MGRHLGRRQGLKAARLPHFFEPIAAHLGRPTCATRSPRAPPRRWSSWSTPSTWARPCGCSTSGCGPGRHARALAARGIEVVGVDISRALHRAGAATGAGRAATFVRRRRRASWPSTASSTPPSRCARGRSGSWPGEDGEVLRRLVRALKPAGRAAVSAFSAYFAVRWLGDGDEFDAAAGVNHELTLVRDEEGDEAAFDLWTTCSRPASCGCWRRRPVPRSTAVWSVSRRGIRPSAARPRTPGVPDDPAPALIGGDAGTSRRRGDRCRLVESAVLAATGSLAGAPPRIRSKAISPPMSDLDAAVPDLRCPRGASDPGDRHPRGRRPATATRPARSSTTTSAALSLEDAIAGTIVEFEDGDIVTGTVVKVDKDEVLLDIGFKSEGVIPARELSIRHDVDPHEVVTLGEQHRGPGPPEGGQGRPPGPLQEAGPVRAGVGHHRADQGARRRRLAARSSRWSRAA